MRYTLFIDFFIDPRNKKKRLKIKPSYININFFVRGILGEGGGSDVAGLLAITAPISKSKLKIEI